MPHLLFAIGFVAVAIGFCRALVALLKAMGRATAWLAGKACWACGMVIALARQRRARLQVTVPSPVARPAPRASQPVAHQASVPTPATRPAPQASAAATAPEAKAMPRRLKATPAQLKQLERLNALVMANWYFATAHEEQDSAFGVLRDKLKAYGILIGRHNGEWCVVDSKAMLATPLRLLLSSIQFRQFMEMRDRYVEAPSVDALEKLFAAPAAADEGRRPQQKH